ncbi:MAG: HAMP domain-containing protein [Firmicutes bacterium]|nr:HAMP domain-containing protein [Bacillota bacterium]
MFKSIFSKLMVIFILIIIFSFSAAGVALYYSLGQYVSTEKINNLKKAGEEINNYLEIYVENASNPLAEVAFQFLLDSYRRNTGSYIWITNDKGFIIFSSPNIRGLDAAIRKHFSFQQGRYKLPDERQYKKVFSGIDPVIETGDFFGLYKDTGWSWLVVQKPFKYTDVNGKEQIIAAVYLTTPITQINKARSTVFSFFITAVFVSAIISILLVYIFSLKITRPLKQISNAAKVIAAGEFSRRLDINTRDEIGDLAKAFNQMVAALQNQEEMRRSFIANVSHELRTPMTSIRGFIEGILDGTIPHEKQKEYLGIVRDEVVRLNRLVNDLLDLARMEAGEIRIVLTDFNINELIRRCIIKLESIITEKNLEVMANFEEEDVFVNADMDAIERVLLNLIHNAVKFTPEGGIIVLSTSTAQKDKVLVCVADNGIGIEKDELDMIWERFYKSDKSRSQDKSGTGLGLAIVKNLINEHGQDIWVESEVGKGTTFYFTLKRVYKDKS